ncbi:MAG: glutathione S-transferase family protein [Alphaproteobacteria bacterium]|nr:glutathione S-transferase family protein [Alphaproteobacteria bacterium]
MYKLYYAPGACSMAVHTALLECNAPFDLEKIDIFAGQGRSLEFLKINPRGQVPVLVEDGHIIREGAAMLIHILEKHQSPLLPRSGPERLEALEWLMFCNATLHPAYSRVFFLKKSQVDQTAKDALMGIAVANINKLWEEVEQRLSQHTYLAGNEVTIADILMTVIANWNGSVPLPVKLGPRTQKLLQSVIARPSYRKALETEQVQYKAVAA